MKPWVRNSLIGAGILSLIGITALSQMKSVDVDLVQAKQQDVLSTVLEKGKLSNGNTQKILAEVQGKVLNVKVDEGMHVKSGTLLATIDVLELEAKLNQLRGELKAVTGSEASAKSQSGINQIKQQEVVVDQAKLAVESAQKDYQRTQALFQEGGATAVEVEDSENALKTARKSLEQAEAALASIRKQSQSNSLQYQGQKESLQAQIDYLASQVSKGKIYASGEGIVYSKKVENGDFVSPGSLLFTIGQSKLSQIETWINSTEMSNVKIGDGVTIVFKRPGEDLKNPGRIIKIAPVTEERTSALGLVEDRVKVTIELSGIPQEVNLTAGSTVDVQVVTSKADHVVAIPKEAVFTDAGQDYVWIARRGQAILTKIQAGLEGDLLIEVKTGIKAGDQIILDPHNTDLKEGVKVIFNLDLGKEYNVA